MIEVSNLQTLRGIGGMTGEIVYVKGHTNAGDGGGGIFMWRTDAVFTGNGIYSPDNNGTIVKASVTSSGRWVRQYDGYINVLFFGALGVGNDYTAEIQSAVSFAALNTQYNPVLKGSTVFIPNGSYKISNIVLKNGVNVWGESMHATHIYSLPGTDGQYLFEIEQGPVSIQVANLNLVGQNTDRGCFQFKAKPNIPSQLDPVAHGGLWNSRLSNIRILGFNGHGIHLAGGEDGSNYMLPNQFNIFENVRVFKNSHHSNALRITGQNGQLTFLNCEFDGFYKNSTYSKGKNIHIQNIVKYHSPVISFINCTCQDADYGIFIEWAENITIDNCWFENLGVAISVKSNFADTVSDVPSKSINILNSRFANAAGFGSLSAPDNIKAGQCVNISKSFVNVHHNYVAVTDPNGADLNAQSAFIIAYNNTQGGVSAKGNTFQAHKLGRTFGLMQIVPVISNTIDCAGHQLVFVTTSNAVIKTIRSFLNAGETLMIRADQGPIKFDDTNNIFLTRKSALTIQNGEIVTFVKIDNIVGPNNETYQLLSITRATS